jgi:hypothetical protein
VFLERVRRVAAGGDAAVESRRDHSPQVVTIPLEELVAGDLVAVPARSIKSCAPESRSAMIVDPSLP